VIAARVIAARVIVRGVLARADVRALAPTAARLGAAGALGAGIGLAARRADVGDIGDVLRDATAAAHTLGALPVWENARRLAESLPTAGLPALLLAFGLGLACVALRLWRAPSAAARPVAGDRAAQVPALAADGVARAEIARRTGLSRDAVALSLRLQARRG
jgi:hypothetical protein